MSAHIIAARRSAVIPRGGAFARLSLEQLAAPVIAALLADAGIAADAVDEVICANALGAGGNPARRVALAAGIGHVAGLTIDRQCVGGLDAILLARALIASGAARVVIAGGVESYSRRPWRLRTDPDGGAAVAYDQPAFTPWPDRDPDMAVAADTLAARFGISRRAQDDWAIASHRAALAADMGREIVPIAGQTHDAFARVLTPALALRAKPISGTITAANAAVAADAAAFVVVVGDGHATSRGMQIIAGATLGFDPMEPGLAPVPAIARVLQQAAITPRDLAVVEMMEAYAAQAIACTLAAKLDVTCMNLSGGALARGHPIGASGAILAVRLFHQLQQGYGLAAIAAAGGLGTAVIVRR